jgi:hypothetical protein
MVAVPLTVIFEKLLLLLLITLPIAEVAVELEYKDCTTPKHCEQSSNNGITVNILISCSGNCHVITNKVLARSIYIQIGKLLLLMFCDRVTAVLLI